MNIALENIGKRFNREWIFRKVTLDFIHGNKYSILGTNGSGKSTLLQIISGSLSQTEGTIRWNGAEPLFKNTSYAAPYLELPEEMTWREAIHFHHRFKRFVSGFNEEKVMELSGLNSSADKQIRNFSSGMKQRAKLSLAILSDTPLLLLDEPVTNLDERAVGWYQDSVNRFAKEKLVIVCSNYNPAEYSFCNETVELHKLTSPPSL